MNFLKGKTVLVTGAGGSIGAELCRQIIQQDPAILLMLDNSEIGLYNIDREINNPRAVPLLGDICRSTRIQAWNSLPDVVYHAAAYKHVTMCEKNPDAVYRVNVQGTRNLVDAARAYKTPKFVLVSTDKAVRPSCVMGQSKQAAEKIVLKAGYTVVRLGNVTRSSGSVIPLWEEQIARGEPVTITDPNATRYFIGPERAADRIIRAAQLDAGTYVAEMGLARNMLDIARRMGAHEFKYTGLRPGEKLHEELFVGDAIMAAPGIWLDTMEESIAKAA